MKKWRGKDSEKERKGKKRREREIEGMESKEEQWIRERRK